MDENEESVLSQDTRHIIEMTEKAEKLHAHQSTSNCNRSDETIENLEISRRNFAKYSFVPNSQKSKKMKMSEKPKLVRLKK